MVDNEEKKSSKCDTYLKEILSWRFIKFTRDKMHELGCDTTDESKFKFSCEPCNNKGVIGMFKTGDNGEKGVIICEDNVDEFNIGKKHIKRTVLHELIHAYDLCRAKMDSNNCEHLACTEIRAALLSGGL